MPQQLFTDLAALLPKPIFLVGMPGCGKTTFGLHLAERFGVDFVDLDAAITREEGISIGHIFAENGEDYFRMIERIALTPLLHLQNTIVATGGGTPCFYQNMEMMNEYGATVWLDAPLPFIINNIQKERASNARKRPLLADGDKSVTEIIHDLYAQRKPFYETAQIIVRIEVI